jgi:hypothetical protein
VFGALVLTGIADIPESKLLRAFANLTTVTGGLSIAGNPSLVSLDCFASLQNCPLVYILDNPELFDARLPLLNATAIVEVNNNPKLCPANYPRGVGGCASTNVSTTIALPGIPAGQFTPAELDRFIAAISNTTGINVSQVSLIAFYGFG